jgi:hypothetical protein
MALRETRLRVEEAHNGAGETCLGAEEAHNGAGETLSLEPRRLTMKPWRLLLEPRRVLKASVADWHPLA